MAMPNPSSGTTRTGITMPGFGDGAFEALGLGDLQDFRDAIGIDGGVDPCPKTYQASNVAGNVIEATALGGAVASKAFRPGGWTNSNRYLRLGGEVSEGIGISEFPEIGSIRRVATSTFGEVHGYETLSGDFDGFSGEV